jgi:hypothetical protein
MVHGPFHCGLSNSLRTYYDEDLKAIGVHLAEISQTIKNRKLAIFGQARCDELKNFISVDFEGHSVIMA